MKTIVDILKSQYAEQSKKIKRLSAELQKLAAADTVESRLKAIEVLKALSGDLIGSALFLIPAKNREKLIERYLNDIRKSVTRQAPSEAAAPKRRRKKKAAAAPKKAGAKRGRKKKATASPKKAGRKRVKKAQKAEAAAPESGAEG